MLRVTDLVGFAVPPGAAAAPVATHSVEFPSPASIANYLSKTFAGAATSNQKATLAFWFKTPDLTTQKCLISTGSASVSADSDFVQHLSATGGVMQSAFGNAAKRRTTIGITAESWNHVCIGMDTTQLNEIDRETIWINLVDVTLHMFDIAQSAVFNWLLQGLPHVIGHRYLAGVRAQPFEGKVAELHWIDGAKLPASAFAVDDAGTPKAIDYENGYGFGANGHLLKFQDDQDLGKDFSGNDLHWTTVGTGLTRSPDAPPSL